MSTKLNEAIKLLSNAFRKKFEDYKGLYLFGSHIDGKDHNGEDIEIVAIFEIEDKSKREQIWPIIGKIETDLDVCIDLYPYTMDDFKHDEEIYDEVKASGIFYNPLGIKQDFTLQD